MKLIIKKLCKSYDFQVIENFNMVIESNLTRIIGENGSGKSTLLKILSGKIKCDSGEIYFNDRKVSINYLAQNSVLIDQDINLFLNETIEFNIKFIARRIDYKLIDEFGFKEDLKKKVNELSGGYKKKLMIMISFMLNPNILLLDEYSSYLDKESLDIINKKIVEYSKDHLVIYVDHNDTLNGDIKRIDDCNLIEEMNCKRIKEKYKFRFYFSLFDLLSVLFLSIFIILSQVSYSFYETTPNEIGANYAKNNNLWLEFIDYDNYNLDYQKYYFYNTSENSSFDFEIYTNDKLQLKIFSNIENQYECYVFSNNLDKYDSFIKIDSKDYYVKGVIDLDIEKYTNFEIGYLFNSVVILDTYSGDNYLECIAINCDKDIKTLYLNNKVLNLFNPYYSNFSYQYIYKIMIFATIIYTILSVLFISINKSKEAHVLSSYSNSKNNLYFNYILSYFIISLFSIILSIILSWHSLIFVYNKVLPNYKINYLRPFKIVLIEYIIFLFIYCISLYFIQARSRKSENDYE